MKSNKEKVINVLKESVINLHTLTGHSCPAIIENDIDYVAGQILSVLDLGGEPQPQLQQADVIGSKKLFRCRDEDMGRERCSDRCKDCQRFYCL